MKIETQLTTPINKLNTAAKESGLHFDALLQEEPNIAGDDYYWQHQHQLQQSALKFTSLANQAKQVSTACNENQERAISDLIASDKLNNTVLGSQLTDKLQNKPLVPIPCPPFEPEQSITAIKPSLEGTGKPLESAITDKSRAKNCNTWLINKQQKPASMTYKNHQLFINNNQAELALNTSPLSKQQTNELQKLIKQWLTNKGYALKQLVINGVSQ